MTADAEPTEGATRPRPCHAKLLDELESHARLWAAATTPTTTTGSGSATAEGAIEWKQRGEGGAWSLAQDARLATFLHEFSIHAQRRASEVAASVRNLEDKARRVATSVESANAAFAIRTDEAFVEQRVRELRG
eukprot:CAMPEP_0183313986 /NCGR_PEP_ID=MMETSP0160_2-20130417/47143_1 /TAXON_ID=2839 ORGANISM="Odontella Sinensis, Strain Grunow 1884" /NCGR_SAMPLE_ID=MMETSP0160_2 /ASSEMBLY_ACC=CAM_ASM_000250 /LENGTH=133 /DNA_ID=CAMNT_0025479195 /DNA_START=14 /DNA_END=412 /DNA_ORIENTATION=-